MKWRVKKQNAWLYNLVFWRRLWSIGGMFCIITACSPNYAHMAEQRLHYAQNNTNDIEVAVIKNSTSSSYVQGVQLAAELVNQRPGKVLNRNIKLHIKAADDGDFSNSRSKVLAIAADPRIVAVLGHGNSSIAIPASVIYERSKIIFICSFATSQVFTRHNFEYIFRMVPSNPVLAGQITNVAETLGYKRMVVLHARDKVSRELAFLFEDKAVKSDIKIIKRASFFEETQDYRSTISGLTKESFDAIFLASPTQSAGRMAKQLREMSLMQPILGGDDISGSLYAETAGRAANNSIAPTIYKVNKKNPLNWFFVQAYRKKYGEEPDRNAAQGYDSLNLLATAIQKTHSTVTSAVSSTLHYMAPVAGVTGVHAFNTAGDVKGKKYFFQVWRDQKLYDLPAIQQFYLLSEFAASLRKGRGEDYQFTDFLNRFTQSMPDEDHKVYLLDLAHEMLNFKRVGIIYENTESGRAIANYAILKKAAKQKNFSIVECNIPFSFLEKAQIKQHLFDCYGKLSLDMDALLVSPYYDVGDDFIRNLHNSLKFYEIPSIAFDGREQYPGISLLLGRRSDILSGKDNSVDVYNDLLNGIKTYEFSERLSGLPEITLNLDDLKHNNKLKSVILDRPVDIYLQSFLN